MNILVVNGYVRQNKGDAALLSVLCQELQKTFPKASLKISSQEDPLQYPTFERWRNVGSLNRYCFDPAWGKVCHLLRLLLSCGAITMLPYLPRRLRQRAAYALPRPLRSPLHSLLEADLVVSMGGGYLNGDRSLMAHVAVYLMLAPLRLAKRFGICAVCAPQSMGPFATRVQKRMVARTLEKVDLILAREKKTMQILSELSARLPLTLSVDSGFLFKAEATTNLRRELRMKPGELLVGVTVRRWLDTKRQAKYEQAVVKTVDYLVSRHKAVVVFIPQVTSSLGGDDDRVTAERVYSKIKHVGHVYLLANDYTHQQIKSLYNELDIIIGTRFHSVIFSLTSHVPALAIEYEHKTSGIMHDLKLDTWVVKIEEATPKVLIRKINELIAAKAHYQQHLREELPAYTARAQKAITLIKRAYQPYR
jgi:colanic acid/amylovoran biosynthesis protein